MRPSTADFATEVTPLTFMQTPANQKRCSPLFAKAAYLSIIIPVLLLFHLSPHNIQTSTIRRDVVENIVVKKMVLEQPTPDFYLPALNHRRNELLGKSGGSRKEGLRWGVVGLGRIAHDFTSA